MSNPRVHRPCTLDEALRILHEEEGARPLAGGTDVLVEFRTGHDRPASFVDLTCIDELRCLEANGERLGLGAMLKHTDVAEAAAVQKYAPVLAMGCSWVGSRQIRNLGTLGGNVVNASPVADTVPPLFVLNATLTLASVRGRRSLPIHDFATGPGVSRIATDELLVRIDVDKMAPDERGFFRRLAQRRLLAIAKLSVAFRARFEGKRIVAPSIALGAVAPKVIFAKTASAFLEGKVLTRRNAREAARLTTGDSTPITDIRSTKDYRESMVGQLLYDGLEELLNGMPRS